MREKGQKRSVLGVFGRGMECFGDGIRVAATAGGGDAASTADLEVGATFQSQFTGRYIPVSIYE
jgi:hypothetical protein